MIYVAVSLLGKGAQSFGSVSVTGGQPGLQIQCFRLIPGKVGSIPIHFRQVRFGGSDSAGVFNKHRHKFFSGENRIRERVCLV